MELKHKDAAMTDRQERIVTRIASEDSVSWLVAKERYFENQVAYDSVEAAQNEPRDEKGKVVKDALTLGEAKLGVTLVVTKAQCLKLGFSEGVSCKDIARSLRMKLGIL